MGEITKIYLVENIEPGTNKVYIGKTKNSRENAHKRYFGSHIEYTCIDEILSLNHNDWEPLETYWIEQFKQWGFEVVNIRKKGGSGPECQSDDTRHRISKSMLGKSKTEEHKRNLSKARTGMKLSEEIKQKISQGRTGVKHKSHKPMPEWYGAFISKINKGRVSPNKGKTKSEEAKRAISEKLKGRISPNKKK